MTITIHNIEKVIGNFDTYVKNNAKASKFAINEIVSRASTESLREAKADWKGLKASDFKKTVKIHKATVGRLEATWLMVSKPIPLYNFSASYRSGATPSGRKRKGGAGVRYKLKSNTRKLGGGSFIKKSKFNSGRPEVFTRRKSPQGADITAHSAITPTSMFESVDGTDLFITKFKDLFPERYFAKINQLTSL